GCLPGSCFYVSYKTGQSKIYVASLKDGTGFRLNDFKGNQLMPAVTYAADKLAFISDYTGNPDLFLQPFSKEEGVLEKPQQVFALKHAVQGSPAFSPDGKKVAFVSNKDGSPKIYVMPIPEKGASIKEIRPELITKISRENSAPSWSQDGLKLAYCSMVKGFRQIFLYDFEKREEVQITDGQYNKENPTFAKNSLHLIFNSTGKNGGELYLMNLNQREAVKISQGKGEKHFPSFEP
ncbi:MAG TPA: translocation protein TolB, partial [Parachlamydiaceae bacterium]|nr:translocation protein TolB [Parachlamydiaceae bacterium]